MSSVLLSGSTGFIGRRCMDLLPQRLIPFGRSDSIVEKFGDCEHIPSDLPIRDIIQKMETFAVDKVVHLATSYITQHDSESISSLVESNLALGLKLLQASSVKGVDEFIFTSSSWETHSDRDPHPANLYAATKRAFTDLASYFASIENLAVTNLVIFDTYGPDDTRNKLVSKLMELGPEESLDLSLGYQKMHLVYVDDVVSGLANLIEAEPSNSNIKSYELTSDKSLSIREIVATIERVRGLRLNVNWGAKPYRRREVMKPFEIGYERPPNWVPTITFQKGLETLLDSS